MDIAQNQQQDALQILAIQRTTVEKNLNQTKTGQKIDISSQLSWTKTVKSGQKSKFLRKSAVLVAYLKQIGG